MRIENTVYTLQYIGGSDISYGKRPSLTQTPSAAASYCMEYDLPRRRLRAARDERATIVTAWTRLYCTWSVPSAPGTTTDGPLTATTLYSITRSRKQLISCFIYAARWVHRTGQPIHQEQVHREGQLQRGPHRAIGDPSPRNKHVEFRIDLTKTRVLGAKKNDLLQGR